jgi:hypothetical protein
LTEVELGPYGLGIADDFGPRVVSLRRDDSPELLAQLTGSHAIEHPGGIYHFHGGHRLWAAPEDPDVTYANDDHACEVSVANGATTVVGPPDSAGLIKSIVVSSRGDDLLIEHTITGGHASQQLAAWAITQFPLGGTAILPLAGEDTGPRPNRNLILWPYTKLDDPRLRFGEGVALITTADGSPLKLGVGPMPQRLGYLRDGWLFIKETGSTPPGTVPDFGAVSQVYLGQGFCELESVGELVDIDDRPASVSEVWRVLACDDEARASDLVLGGNAQ